jgi:hypothetical protein
MGRCYVFDPIGVFTVLIKEAKEQVEVNGFEHAAR